MKAKKRGWFHCQKVFTALLFGIITSLATTPDSVLAIEDKRVDGVSVGGVSSYMFANAAKNHTIESTFKADTALSPAIAAPTRPKAVIVAGGGSIKDNILWEATRNCAVIAFRALITLGYARDEIYLLSSDADIDMDGNGILDDVDNDATISNLVYAIETWAKDADDLLVYMTGPGGFETFRMNQDEVLHPADLDASLDSVQETIPGIVTFVYDTCRAGSFLPALKPPPGKERVLVASAADNETALFATRGVVSFSFFFWVSMINGDSFYDSFVNAKNGIGVAFDQNPVLEVNGNGITNEKEDKNPAQHDPIGWRITSAIENPPLQITPDEFENDDGYKSANFIDPSDPANKSITGFRGVQLHNFHDADDEDWIEFDARGLDQVFRIIASSPGAKCDTVIDIYMGDGETWIKTVDDHGAGTNEIAEFSPTLTGLYYARIRNNSPWTYEPGSDYRLRLIRAQKQHEGVITGHVKPKVAGTVLWSSCGGEARTDSGGFYFMEAVSGDCVLHAERPGHRKFCTPIYVSKIKHTHFDPTLQSTIKVIARDGGAISPDASPPADPQCPTPAPGVAVDYGASQSFTITPDDGYVIEDVRVDGVSTMDSNPIYTFENVRTNHTIEAIFIAYTPSPPTVATGGASSMTAASAILNGAVNPNGQSASYYFEYGGTASLGYSSLEEDAGDGEVDAPVSAEISGLYPDTIYHCRLVAYNSAGITLGEVKTFRTLPTPKRHKAIIVAGGGPYEGNTLWEATKQCANLAYRALIFQGYDKHDIYYLSSDHSVDIDGDGDANDVDAMATKSSFEYAIDERALDTDSLLIYMVDHGGHGIFRMGEYETLEAEVLDSWLNDLQETIPEEVIIVYDASQSGSFLPLLKPPAGKQRIVAASASDGEASIFAAKGVLSFSFYFWGSFINGESFYKSFVNAKNSIGLTYDQNPVLDANGNGIANEQEDKAMAREIQLGAGIIIPR